MTRLEDLRPEGENQEEKQWSDKLQEMTDLYSKGIREKHKEDRLPYLRSRNLQDHLLLALFLKAQEREDFETCEVAKVLINERGITIPE